MAGRKKVNSDYRLAEFNERNSKRAGKNISRGIQVASALNNDFTWHAMAIRTAESVDEFIEFLRYATPDEEGKIEEVSAAWRDRTEGAYLDEVLKAVDVDPARVFGWAAEGAARKHGLANKIKMARHSGKVLDANIDSAQGPLGFQDRMLFFRASGMLPTPGGTRINVNQTNLNSAQAKADADTQLPAFESSRREIADIVRADD